MRMLLKSFKICFFTTSLLFVVFTSFGFVSTAKAGIIVLNDKSVPRFASTKFDSVNTRFGPGKNYPTQFEINKKYLPVMIVKEYDNWYLVQMPDGVKSWLHKSQVTGKRYGMITSKQVNMFENTDDLSDGDIIAKIGKGNLVRLYKCRADSIFCYAEIDYIKGYIRRSDIFGLLEDEDFKD